MRIATEIVARVESVLRPFSIVLDGRDRLFKCWRRKAARDHFEPVLPRLIVEHDSHFDAVEFRTKTVGHAFDDGKAPARKESSSVLTRLEAHGPAVVHRENVAHAAGKQEITDTMAMLIAPDHRPADVGFAFEASGREASARNEFGVVDDDEIGTREAIEELLKPTALLQKEVPRSVAVENS